MEQSFYEILGVSPNATQPELRKAYRALVLDLHPDRNPDPLATAKFMQVTQAYETLSNSEKRSNYDRVMRLNREIEDSQKRASQARKSEQDKPSRKSEPKKQARTSQDHRNYEPVDWTKTKIKTAGYQTSGDPPNPNLNPNPNPNPNSNPNSNAQANSRANTQANTQKASKDPRQKLTPTDDLLRLTALATRARYAEAEKLARKIIERTPNQPLPYAILGDIHRMRGQYREALVNYSYAIQADPVNMAYQRKHDEVLKNLSSPSMQLFEEESKKLHPSSAMALGGLVTLCGLVYVILSKEPTSFDFPIIDSWTTGLVVMMAIAGMAIGSAMSLAGWLDRITNQYQSAVVSISPGLALCFLATLNFWIASAVYVFIGATENVFNLSSSRLLGAVAGVTFLFAFAGAVSEKIEFFQVLLWGGNVLYLGAVLGWAVADGVRDSH